MEAVAKLRNNQRSPRKMRLAADLIRGENVIDALNILKFTKNHSARDLEKLLRSAMANWEAKNPSADMDDADLFVKTITVDPGRTLKRIQPAPFGRAHRIRRRSNHTTITVDGRNPVPEVTQPVEQPATEVTETEDA